eukprot:545754_1
MLTVCCLFNLLKEIIMRWSSTDFAYESTNIDMRINVDNDNDIIQLQKKKDLTKNLKTLLAKLFEMHTIDIEIINTKDSSHGIIISCIKYEKVLNSRHSTFFYTKHNDKFKPATIELQKSLLGDVGNNLMDNDFKLRMDSMKPQLSSDRTKLLIQQLYGLQSIPFNICYDINIQSVNNRTFTTSIST